MPTTPKLLLPYPNEVDNADTPADFKNLAGRLDAVAGVASGLASLDSGGKVPVAQLPSGVFVPQGAVGVANGVASLDGSTKVPMPQLYTGVAGGVASLDGNAKVPASQLPAPAAQVTPFMTGDYKVSAIAATHADPNGGSWLLCDGLAVPAQYTALIALIGSVTPDARGRVLTTIGVNAAVNAVGKSDGLGPAARRPQHRHTPHAHTVAANRLGATSGNAGSNWQDGSTATSSVDGGSGVAGDSLDAPAFCVVGSLFIHT